MAITSLEHAGRTIYFVTEQKEFDDLAKKNQVVYLTSELEAVEQLNDEEFKAFLYRAKLLLPNTRYYDTR